MTSLTEKLLFGLLILYCYTHSLLLVLLNLSTAGLITSIKQTAEFCSMTTLLLVLFMECLNIVLQTRQEHLNAEERGGCLGDTEIINRDFKNGIAISVSMLMFLEINGDHCKLNLGPQYLVLFSPAQEN